jgi:cell division protein FtsL
VNTIVPHNNLFLPHQNRREWQPLRRNRLQTIFAHQPVKWGLYFFFVFFFVTALIILYLWQDAALLQLNLQLAKIEEQIAEIEAENRRLEFQVQQAFSLERISTFARHRLRMVEPTNIRYINLSSSPDE